MILSISGMPGSGKTSAGNIVAQKLGVSFYSTGSLFRTLAKERGISLNELMKLGEEDKSIHATIDQYQERLGQEQSDFVIEGRLSWHFIPHSFKVLLLCNTHEAARRIYEAKLASQKERADEKVYRTIEEAEQSLIERNTSDILGYKRHYGIDYSDPTHFDLVIDTTTSDGPEETAERILKAFPRI